MKPIASSDSNYGIVIDAGSSGSRIHVYQWANPEKTQKKLLHKNKGGEEYNRQSKGELAMLPEIIHKKDWNKKTSPGISSFGYKYEGKTSKKELKKFAEDLWENHLEDLVEFAEKIIPDKNDQLNTPIFLLATAGMRLLKPKDQTKILNTSCHLLKKKTHFKIPECENHVDVINGDTEGLYGWLALNYLLDQFNGNSQSEKQRNSFGFMDMGGASTQIAFLPSEKESIRHFDDLYKINLRTLDGKDLASDIFVSSWLGFGANEARRRHFENLKKQQKPQLLNPDDYDFEIVLPKKMKKRIMIRTDPCAPKGNVFKHDLDDSTVFLGNGNYEECFESMHPLLKKDLPCSDEPCPFGGIHVPEIDFTKTKFIGISEFWYTSQDLFKMNGDYDFLTFKNHVDSYCSRPWKEIMNDRDYRYNGLDDAKLQAACFKASWIINILHEGFGLPMTSNPLTNFGENNKLVHYLDSKTSLENIDFDSLDPFRSVESINSKELSWTLGRIILYASSQVPTIDGLSSKVGFTPSISSPNKKFVHGGEGKYIKNNKFYYDKEGRSRLFAFETLSVFIFIFALVILMGYALFSDRFSAKRRQFFHQLKLNKFKARVSESPLTMHFSHHYGKIKANVMGRYNLWRYGYGLLDTSYQRVMEEGGNGETHLNSETRNEYNINLENLNYPQSCVSSPSSLLSFPPRGISRADTAILSTLEKTRRDGIMGQFSASTPNLSSLTTPNNGELCETYHSGVYSGGNSSNSNKECLSSNPYLARHVFSNNDDYDIDHLDDLRLVKSTSRLFNGNLSRERQVLGNKSSTTLPEI